METVGDRIRVRSEEKLLSKQSRRILRKSRWLGVALLSALCLPDGAQSRVVDRVAGETNFISSTTMSSEPDSLERAWAEQCGLGFIGNNTCLIHRSRGSYFFLGAVLVAEEIGDLGLEIIPNLQSQISPKSRSGCGRCVRCLTACPTQAFPAPGVLDARRCISYLTIEQKGSIPLELRPLMGNWIFGCDVCQEVCPYVRRYSTPAREKAFYPADIERAAPRLLDVLALDRNRFNARYKSAPSPVARAKRRGLLRNACVATGNWGSQDALPALETLLSDDEPLIREHAAWAIMRIKENE